MLMVSWDWMEWMDGESGVSKAVDKSGRTGL
jgi:hypothetical protein